MPVISTIAEIATLIGDPARMNMLMALKDDGQISAGDLANVGGVAASTASEHLAKLTEAGLVVMTPRGRKRYYGLTSPEVADILEGIENLAVKLRNENPRPLPNHQAMLHARRCSDHLSGKVGTRMTMAMMEKGYLRQDAPDPYLSDEGVVWLKRLHVDVDALKTEPRRVLSLCPDWTERSVHIGGAVGAALLRGFLHRDWLRRQTGSRVVTITPKGRTGIRDAFGFDVGLLSN